MIGLFGEDGIENGEAFVEVSEFVECDAVFDLVIEVIGFEFVALFECGECFVGAFGVEHRPSFLFHSSDSCIVCHGNHRSFIDGMSRIGRETAAFGGKCL